MNFEKVISEVKTLKAQIEDNKVNTEFEKNKLKSYLGKYNYNKFKELNIIIAGGMISSLFTNSEINDVDIYFRSKEDLINFIYEYYDKYIVSHTKKATMFKDIDNITKREILIQAIHFKYFDSVEELFNTFDFTHSMGAFDFKTEEFVFHKDFLKHNAQRILKFNPNTAYPLISLIRMNKFIDRNYTISKPELMRIVLTCMNLNIESYEELDEHLEGMYGEAWNNMLEGMSEDEEFSLSNVIAKLQDLALHEDYFKIPEQIAFEDEDDLIESILKVEPTFIKADTRYFKLSHNGNIKYFSQDEPKGGKIIHGEDYFNNRKFYKFVKKIDDGVYVSYYDNAFKYEIGKESVGKNTYLGLFFNELKDISQSSYVGRDDKCLIEVKVDGNSLIGCDDASSGSWQFLKCYVLREVPKDEWVEFIKDFN